MKKKVLICCLCLAFAVSLIILSNKSLLGEVSQESYPYAPIAVDSVESVLFKCSVGITEREVGFVVYELDTEQQQDFINILNSLVNQHYPNDFSYHNDPNIMVKLKDGTVYYVSKGGGGATFRVNQYIYKAETPQAAYALSYYRAEIDSLVDTLFSEGKIELSNDEIFPSILPKK